MKASSLFAILTTSIVLLTGCGEDKKTSNKDRLIIGTSADYAPYEFFKDGKITGFDIELIEKISEKLGKTAEVKDMSFDAILGALQTKRIDVAISSITPTEERQKAVDFSDPYFDAGKVLVCRSELNIHSTADLNGTVVGVQLGSVYETYANGELRDLAPGVEVRSLGKIPDLVQDLKSGRLSCLIVGTTEGTSLAKTHTGLVAIPLSTSDSTIAIAAPKGSPLISEINKVLDEFKQDGTLDSLKKKWLDK